MFYASRMAMCRALIPKLAYDNNSLVFWTACDPSTTFDPKITGVSGTWYFDDGTTLAAASGAEISKTFAAEGLHRAVFRPASGGLAAVTGVAADADSLTSIGNLNRTRITTLDTRANTGLVISTNAIRQVSSSWNGYNCLINGNLAGLQMVSLLIGATYSISGLAGTLSDLSALSETVQLYNRSGITPGSIAHLTALRDGRFYSMWPALSAAESVDIVINSMWTARAAYTYASGPSMQIGGTNQAPSGNAIAPVEGTDWHQDGATWIPLTAGAKIYDLANNVNSEVRPSWAITYTA